MSIGLFILFFFTTFVLGYLLTFLLWGHNTYSNTFRDVSNKCGLALTATIVAGWTLLQVSTPPDSWPYDWFLFGFFPFLIGCVGLSLYSIRKGFFHRYWAFLFVTLLSVSFFPTNLLVFDGYLPFLLDRMITAILWAAFIQIYTRLDKIDGLTAIQTEFLCLGFLLFPILQPQIISINFAPYPLILIAALMGFSFYKKKNPFLTLGKTGAAPLGYLMGFFFIYLALNGMWLPVVIMPAYYYFETIYSLFQQVFHRKNAEPVVLTFYLSRIIAEKLDKKKVLGILRYHLLILSMAGAVSPFFSRVPLWYGGVAIILTVIFLNLTQKLSAIGEPKVTIVSTLKDSKKALCDIFNEVSTRLKK